MLTNIRQFFEVIPPAVGLDISDSSIKYAQLERSGRYFKLVAYGERDIPSGVVESGKVKDAKKLSDVLREALIEKGPKGLSRYVVASIPDEEVFLKMITMPNVPDKEIDSSILVEAERNIPIPSDNMYLDHESLGFHPERKHLDILLSASRKDSIDTYIEAINNAGLKPLAMEPEVAAISRSAIKGGETKKPVIILEVGANRTRLIVFVKNAPIITGATDFSAPDVTKTIAGVLGIEEAKAKELQWTPDLLEDDKVGDSLKQALHPLYQKLIESINNYSAFLQDREDNRDPEMHQVDKVIVSGGGARIPGIAESLSMQLQLPVEIVNPWVNVLPPRLKEIPELSRSEAVRFTTAIGLALYGSNVKKVYTNK